MMAQNVYEILFLRLKLKYHSPIILLNEECHAAKEKQTVELFLGTAEICQLFYSAAKNVRINSI